VYRIDVTGTVENGLAPYIARGLSEAEAAGADAVYLDIDTPGGRVDAAERISDAIRAAAIPVYAFVNPRAFSAGALIAISTTAVYMGPGAVMGAATPVDGEGVRASEKMVSAMRAEFRAVAEQRGLDPRIAEAMVDERIAIPGLDPADELLTLTTAEALRVGYAKAEVADEAALLQAVGLPGARVVPLEPNWAEQVVRFLTNPLVAPLLLSLGVLGLVFEIKTGAFGIGGLLSLTSLGLFFGSSFVLGLAGWEEILLLGLGLVALAVEVLVLPGFGVAGILGLAAIGGAMALAMMGAAPTTGDVVQALAVLGASLVITAAVVFAWLRHLPNSGRFDGLYLKGRMAQSEGYISAPRTELVGQDGIALTDLRPAGTARIGTERVDVVTEGEYVPQGSAVQVIRSEGYRHVVRELVESRGSSV
ncbi:MAG: ATP-dependent Clp protease proteolytic subunit, partial [Gemmatimonadales bacterium]|nr:ATP-dependent Clp protease proteolytic subunit [Gemmatimonadales bacterium]